MSTTMASINRVWCTFLLILFLCTKVSSYEKTLRKIVRNQFKMIQRPFSDSSGPSLWNNSTISSVNFPSSPKSRTMNHNLNKHKMSTILSTVDKVKSSYSKRIITKTEVPDRQTRNTLTETSNNKKVTSTQSNNNESNPTVHDNNLTVKNFYQVPVPSKYFPLIFDRENSLEQKGTNIGNTIIIPSIPPKSEENETGTIQVKGILIPKSQIKSPSFDFEDVSNETRRVKKVNSEKDKVDFIFDEQSSDITESKNYTADIFTCLVLKEAPADIDAQEKFAQFNIEPAWMKKKQYWDKIFDIRYEALMRNSKWPPLQVILIPRVHIDSIWKKTFEQYHQESVSVILSNMVKKLQFYKGLTFSWNEISHLSQWWKKTSNKNRMAFRKLVKDGRLEITTGSWVETDEATTHLFGLVHLLIEGHQWLKLHLNHYPKVAWLTNTVTHSPTMIYLLSTLNVHHVVFTNVHYAWERFLAEYQYSDFIWQQSWDNDKLFTSVLNKDLNNLGNDRYPKHAALTHYIQFNSAGFRACGPNGPLCASGFNFASSILDINPYSLKDKAEELLEQYSKSGSISLHNTIMAPLGGPYHYEIQTEFDYQFNNYLKILDFVNTNTEIYKATLEFGTAHRYFDVIMNKRKRYPTLKGDFPNFADVHSKTPAYWTGFYTSRPFTKILLRRLQSTLRTTEILFSFALNFNVFRQYNLADIYELLLRAREIVARLLDRNVVSGTVTANTLKYVHNQILATVKDCWFIQELTASFFILKPKQNLPYLQKYVYKDGEFMSVFRSISPGDHICIFNSLSHQRTEIVEIVTRYPNIRIMDRNNKDLTIQVNPIWKFNSNDVVKLSRRFFKIIFVVVLPPMTLALYKIKETYDATHNAAALYCFSCVIDETKGTRTQFPFNIKPIQPGDIQLESYKYRLMFDEYTGFLKTVVEKETNTKKTVYIDYGAFKGANINSGMFLFNTNTSSPLYDILFNYRLDKKPKIIIVSGQVTTELVTIYGRLLQHTTKIYNLLSSPLANVIYVESKIDYELSPKNRELEMFLSIQTDIRNGNPPQIFTDNNSFQYTPRYLNLSKRIESNLYPITSMAFIQDKSNRLTYLTDHAQGVTALQEGQLIVMLDRRILYDDDRGTNEGLADSSATCHRHYILLERMGEPSGSNGFSQFTSQDDITLPSLNALYLANGLNYLIDVFVVEKNHTNLCYYTYLPLIKSGFPCDVSVVNYRVNLNRKNLKEDPPNSALLILQRQTPSCKIERASTLHCHGENTFDIDKIMRNVKTVYHTNLAGTNTGVNMININYANFPHMELMTLRINF